MAREQRPAAVEAGRGASMLAPVSCSTRNAGGQPGRPPRRASGHQTSIRLRFRQLWT